jgi:Cys/Met metabolism PLP-dependent enzyme
VSFEVTGGYQEAVSVLRGTRVFTLAESLGGVESLIEHPASMSHASMRVEQRQEAGISDGLIRLSVGIEGIEDLLDDLEHALEQHSERAGDRSVDRAATDIRSSPAPDRGTDLPPSRSAAPSYQERERVSPSPK